MKKLLILASTLIIAVVYFSTEAEPSHIIGGRLNAGQFIKSVEIIRSNGEYVWASNGNKPLHKMVWSGFDHNGEARRISYFVSPDGAGYVAITHDPTHWSGSLKHDIREENLTEYKLTEDGNFVRLLTTTQDWPFPGRKWGLLRAE